MEDFVFWALLTVAILGGVLLLAGLGLLAWILHTYMGVLTRIFTEKPLFIIPRGRPLPDSEDVRFPSGKGLMLAGSYLRTPAESRRGVILFAPAFDASRWSCGPYLEHLRTAGFDIFTFDFRNHGDSPVEDGYQPLQWFTKREVEDLRAAISYLKQRPDADPRGIGVFGISRGGSVALFTAATEPWVRCLVTDGAFGTVSTMVPFMLKWVTIYSQRLRLRRWLPLRFYRLIAVITVWWTGRRRGCTFPALERKMGKLGERPLLMIHGASDSYIKPVSVQELFDRVRGPKELWMVANAKHNLGLQMAGETYRQRVLDFFTQHLAPPIVAAEPACEEVISYQSSVISEKAPGAGLEV